MYVFYRKFYDYWALYLKCLFYILKYGICILERCCNFLRFVWFEVCWFENKMKQLNFFIYESKFIKFIYVKIFKSIVGCKILLVILYKQCISNDDWCVMFFVQVEVYFLCKEDICVNNCY